MEKTDERYTAYVTILSEELVPAMGCTEPISIAYAAAKARAVLGQEPDRVVIEASDNIVKNVKSVVVPNTGHLKGIRAAAAAGIVAGDPDKVLEVISCVDDTGRKKIHDFLENTDIQVKNSQSGFLFDILVTVYAGTSNASVRITHFHTNITSITRNGEVLLANGNCNEVESSTLTDRSIMNVKDSGLCSVGGYGRRGRFAPTTGGI